jgi:hypothetical protein
MATPLEEALTAVGAQALIQKRIDPNLLEYQRRYAPLVRTLPTTPWNSTVYYFNNRTQQPSGGFVTDGGARAVTTSTYNQNLYPIKLLQVVGAVTGYAQAVTADLIGNLRAKEIMGAAKRLYWSVENAICWGNATATAGGPYPQFDGLDTIANVYSGSTQNAINFQGGAFDLGALDQLIDLVENNVSEDVCNSEWMFVLSPTAVSRLAQLFTNQQRFVDEVEVATGLIVPSYRNVPLVKTNFLSPRGSAMSAITAAGVSSGGALANGTYYYYVSFIVDVNGESQVQQLEVNASVTGNGVITLSFTPPTGFENGVPLSYKVYRGTSSGAESLLGYVDANVSPTQGQAQPSDIVQANQIIDNGVTLIPQYSVGSVQNASNPATYAAIGENSNEFPLNTNSGQKVYLIARNSDYIMRPYVREFTPVDVYPTTASPDSLPFATVTDTTLAVRAPKYMGKLANTTVSLSS